MVGNQRVWPVIRVALAPWLAVLGAGSYRGVDDMRIIFSFVFVFLFFAAPAAPQDAADLILHSGKVVTADAEFSIAEAIAVRDGRIESVGTTSEIMQLSGPNTQSIDLDGKTVLPGLIDSHVHAIDASMVEFDHPIPSLESIADVLDYIKQRTAVVPEGDWIVLRQVFITRLREQRYPTKAELDRVAPKHPVAFRTGPDASVNSLALELSGIDKNSTNTASGLVERDPRTGEPSGILRSAEKYLKIDERPRRASDAERDERLVELFADYNRTGITAAIDRSCSQSEQQQYKRLYDAGRLTVRMALSRHIDTSQRLDAIQEDIRQVAKEPLCKGDSKLRIIGIKTFFDGGMLTGSAYMRSPWGVSSIYGIDDPAYRGLRYIPEDTLAAIVETAVKNGLQFTAHSVGDGAVHALLDAYEKVNESHPIQDNRCCITHSNFMSKDAIEAAAKLGVSLDIQPAWLYLDTRTLAAQFGYDRLRYFQPLRTIFEKGVIAGGGSDHMQKLGSLRSVNPYNPFLGMWVTITRRAKGYDGQLHPEESLTRDQAIRFYTWNNAFLMFREHEIGSLEPGKLADFIVIDRDLLSCPEDEIKDTQVLATFLAGKRIWNGDS